MFYVYLLQSNRFLQIYIGSTDDLKVRLLQHNAGQQPSTRRYRPWRLVYYEAYQLMHLARLREKKLKQHGNAVKELKIRAGLTQQRQKFPLA